MMEFGAKANTISQARWLAVLQVLAFHRPGRSMTLPVATRMPLERVVACSSPTVVGVSIFLTAGIRSMTETGINSAATVRFGKTWCDCG
jgi:hypothetical protein